FNGGRFGQVQRLALRHAVDDIEEDDIAKFFHRRQKRQRPADLPGPDQTYLLARHRNFSSTLRDRHPLPRGGGFAGAIDLSMHAIKPNFWPRSSKSAAGEMTQIKSLYFSQTMRGSRNGERLPNCVTEAPKRHSASQHQTILFNSSR